MNVMNAPAKARAAQVEGRKLVGFERHYRCDSCSGERRSWSRLRSCPDCGEPLTSARILRAAVA